MIKIEDILRKCSGVEIKRKENPSSYSSQKYTETFHKVGDIKLLTDDIFIKITSTATKGTIAKVVDIEIETYLDRWPNSTTDSPDQIVTYDNTLIYEVQGRKQRGRIKHYHAEILKGHHKTKYVRNVTNHKKVEIKNPVNKYKQELQRGDWVVGVRYGRRLGIGRITRWTDSNVWGVTGDDLDDKSKEFKFDSIRETFTMPDDEHVPLLTMAVLKGWNGV